MANIRVDSPVAVYSGLTLTFKSPADCSQITGLSVYYRQNDQEVKTEFQFADAHGNNVGDLDLFAANVVVKVILDTVHNRAYVQNADTNAYLEGKFTQLGQHANSKGNVHNMTPSDIGAAASSHNHSASNITSGTLPIARGGTGATTAAAARNALGLGNTSGAVPVANGGTGSTTAAAARTALGITPSNIGAAASSHNHTLSNITDAGSKLYYADASRPANTVLAAPNGSAGVGSFRSLVAADLPTIPVSKGGTGATSATNALKNLGGASVKVLWTNPNPTNGFAATTIGVSWKDYDIIMITAYGWYSGASVILSTSANQAAHGEHFWGHLHWGFVEGGYMYHADRHVLLQSNGIEIGNCVVGTTEQTGRLVPYKIYGIKGVT